MGYILCTTAEVLARSAVSDNIFGPWKELGNPCTSKDSLTIYYSQSTYILSVQGKKDAFIFMADL